jgi:hypothetical protein
LPAWPIPLEGIQEVELGGNDRKLAR